jgi:hypothetical protein
MRVLKNNNFFSQFYNKKGKKKEMSSELEAKALKRIETLAVSVRNLEIQVYILEDLLREKKIAIPIWDFLRLRDSCNVEEERKGQKKHESESSSKKSAKRRRTEKPKKPYVRKVPAKKEEVQETNEKEKAEETQKKEEETQKSAE